MSEWLKLMLEEIAERRRAAEAARREAERRAGEGRAADRSPPPADCGEADEK